MTKHEQLVVKIKAEQTEYLAEMQTKTPAEIIQRAYEICYREDIAVSLTSMNLDDQDLDFLLALPNPVGFMYSEWLKVDASVCDMLEDTIRDVLNENYYNECDHCNRPLCYGCPHVN